MMHLLFTLLVWLLAVPAWAVADLPTLPTEFDPGTTPTPGTSKSVCATKAITAATAASPIVVTTSSVQYWVTGQTVTIAGMAANGLSGADGVRTVTALDATASATAATAASPIVITTSATHYWQTGQQVKAIAFSANGLQGADGWRTITRIDATHFSLDGTTGVGTYDGSGASFEAVGGTRFSLDGTTGSGAYGGSGGTAACDYSSLQTALDAATSGWTLYLNQGETYTPPTGSTNFNTGIVLPQKSSTTYTVIRTYDDNSGHLPAEGERLDPTRHSPYLARLQLQDSSVAWRHITCKAGANYYWLKAIWFRLPDGGLTNTNPFDGAINCSDTGGAGWANPPRKWVDSTAGITYGGGSVVVNFDTARVGAVQGIDPPQWVFVRCPVSCGLTGLANVQRTVTAQTSTSITFADPGVSGAYTWDTSHYVELDSSMYPTHLVLDQVLYQVIGLIPSGSTQRWANAFWNPTGSDLALVNSYIEVEGNAVGVERGKVILCVTGCQRVMIRNNFMAGSTFSSALIAAESNVKGYDATDWVVRRNTITRPSRWIQQKGDSASNHYNQGYKNLFETKHGDRVLIEGNLFTGGFGDSQSTMIHLTNVSNDTVNTATCGATTGVEGEGCHPEGRLLDVTFRHNIVKQIGQICMDVIGQNAETGASNRYAHQRANRILIDNNLFDGCGGWPYHSRWIAQPTTAIGAISTSGGPQNMTVRHNTFLPPGERAVGGPWKAAQWPWFKAYCSMADNPSNNILQTDGVTRYGTVTGCPDTIGATTQHASGKLPNLTIVDNIIWGNSNSNAGAFAFASSSSGAPIACRRDNAFDLMTDSTGTWHHNIIVGAVPGSGATKCDMNVIAGTEVLATGSVVVTDSAAMNYRDWAGHDYRLTASSPGYRAASDGTDVGVNWETLMAAVLGTN